MQQELASGDRLPERFIEIVGHHLPRNRSCTLLGRKITLLRAARHHEFFVKSMVEWAHVFCTPAFPP
jgi:hypothetical protein